MIQLTCVYIFMLAHLQGNILEKYVGTGMVRVMVNLYNLRLYFIYPTFLIYSFFWAIVVQQFGAASGRNADMLFLDKKEIGQLLKIVRSQS